MNYKEIQRKTTMVFPNRKGWENQKEEDQEQVKDLVRQNHPFGKPPFSQSLSVCNRDSYEIQGADKRWKLQIGVRPLRSVLLSPCGKKKCSLNGVFQSGLFIRPNKQNENNIWKGVDEKKHGMLKGMTEEKKDKKKWKTESVFEKRVWGGGGRKKGAKHLSNCRVSPFFCLTDNNTPLKNPRIAGKTALVVIISKQNNRHKHKKGKSTKKITTQQQSRQQQEKNQEAQNARNLGLERRCDGTGLKWKQQNSRKVERRRKRIGQSQQN